MNLLTEDHVKESKYKIPQSFQAHHGCDYTAPMKKAGFGRGSVLEGNVYGRSARCLISAKAHRRDQMTVHCVMHVPLRLHMRTRLPT